MTANSRHRLAGRTEEGELTDMTDATDKKIENITDATATATDETTEEKAAATEDVTAPACDCCCGVHMGEADGKTDAEPVHEAADGFECSDHTEHVCECHDTDTDTDTEKSRAEAVKAKHVVDGAATVGKNVAGVVKKFVSTLVSKGGKDDTDGVQTDAEKGE